MNAFLAACLSARLIQFGHFVVNGVAVPLRTDFDLLASYPAALRALVAAVPPLAVDRLLCPADAVPFGIALSLHTGIPLVYSRGGNGDPTADWVGAYDIGHPAALIVTVAGLDETAEQFSRAAARVGLHITQIVAVLNAGTQASPVPVWAALTLPSLLDDLVAGSELPPGQVAAVRAWLTERTPT